MIGCPRLPVRRRFGSARITPHRQAVVGTFTYRARVTTIEERLQPCDAPYCCRGTRGVGFPDYNPAAESYTCPTVTCGASARAPGIAAGSMRPAASPTAQGRAPGAHATEGNRQRFDFFADFDSIDVGNGARGSGHSFVHRADALCLLCVDQDTNLTNRVLTSARRNMPGPRQRSPPRGPRSRAERT